MSEDAVLARAELAASASQELLQRSAEVANAGEVTKVVGPASRCHHVLLACLSRYDHDISTD
jgi:hypothetical protein